MSSQTTIFNETTVEIPVDEYEYLKACERELAQTKKAIGEILGGKQYEF